jgi:hypothetical protein
MMTTRRKEAFMFSMTLRAADKVREYSVSPLQEAGWEVVLSENRTVCYRIVYRDWHRVERAVSMFRLEASQLMACGWEEV